MPVFIDQTGRRVTINSHPQRIISLVPSQTELLFDLGLGDAVIGITKFCIHPNEWFRSKTRVGGTKQIRADLIHQLRPDLVIGNKEENVKEQIEELEKGYPIWVSDVNDLAGAYTMIEQVGLITGKERAAKEIINEIKENFRKNSIHSHRLPGNGRYPAPGSPLTAIYLIWQHPYMATGGDTFIHTMMEAAGLTNLYGEKKRYPEITQTDIQKLQPDLLLLSSEPFPFTQKQADELQAYLPHTRVVRVDGELFSWYGSRLRLAPAYFSALHSQLAGTLR